MQRKLPSIALHYRVRDISKCHESHLLKEEGS